MSVNGCTNSSSIAAFSYSSSPVSDAGHHFFGIARAAYIQQRQILLEGFEAFAAVGVRVNQRLELLGTGGRHTDLLQDLLVVIHLLRERRQGNNGVRNSAKHAHSIE